MNQQKQGWQTRKAPGFPLGFFALFRKGLAKEQLSLLKSELRVREMTAGCAPLKARCEAPWP